ncbi:MAG TPA: hypothetical protein VES69_02230 [Pyrinomonadaceae bacterium]|nr:hypothetical protein [Pyrinomonadaceae bacterium]
MNSWIRRIVFIAATLSVMSLLAFAQDKSRGSLTCRDNWYSDRLMGHCEIKEQTVAAGGTITVDARKNGGVSVKGWDRSEVLVRARIQTSASTQSEADDLAKQIRIETGGGKIFAEGPENRRDYHWDVSYEIFVPRRSDLSLEAYNGGISIADVSGRIEFTGHNGGVVLKRVGGLVRGGTTNGGVVVELDGARWDGETLDVKTTNGGIVMSVPENYSAHLETGTVNGHLSVDFPVTVQGRITRELAVNLGSGGPTVRATTTNGGVKIKRTGNN